MRRCTRCKRFVLIGRLHTCKMRDDDVSIDDVDRSADALAPTTVQPIRAEHVRVVPSPALRKTISIATSVRVGRVQEAMPSPTSRYELEDPNVRGPLDVIEAVASALSSGSTDSSPSFDVIPDSSPSSPDSFDPGGGSGGGGGADGTW